ncbi:adhesin YadA [Yersinia enterocolitica subsp. enterocolitica WA-314]|uniref:trimeric autotransporter adhesin YadA n=1 Tax=Yersinia enterocolitica TaxID=630 RepID=UPI0001E7AA33|nr:trimeric autotransporter adhesin YadA [Yersinia enterocolitica]AJI81101.1 adhesin yadA [Yersinia enterocolitica]EKA25166.1 adhesin YadA [Yersinia enterocolitica subsp. enterocolitica WA-314]CBW54734.1 YadA, Yersinia Adhesin A, PMID 18397894 [Yersinia enterocolitica (type O:8)]CNK41865.1 putative YadA invasin [Yersinia enterocolitica]VFT03971.1 Immunoglobulin-binding protein from prophage P-EibD [Yersinia enterocolitica]
MTKDFKISVSAALISALFSSPYAFANNDEVHFTAVQISPNSDPDSHVMIFQPEVRAPGGTNALAKGTHSIAVGASAEAAERAAVAVGAGSIATGVNSVAIGPLSKALGDSAVTYGAGSTAQKDGVAIGARASTSDTGVAVGFNSKVDAKNSVAIGHSSHVVVDHDYSIAIGDRSKTDRKNSVSIGHESLNRQLTHLAAGTKDTDAVNVAQLKKEIEKTQENANKKSAEVLGIANNYTDSKSAETLENARKEAFDLSNDALDMAKKHSNSVARTTLETAEEHTNKKSAETLASANVYADSKSSHTLKTANSYTDVTVSNSTKKAIRESNQYTDHKFHQLDNRLDKLDTRVDKGLASSAALNSLFQPYGVGKVNFTAGVGGYRSSQALAIGSGYRVNESVALKAGVAYAGSSDVMYNASFNIEW